MFFGSTKKKNQKENVPHGIRRIFDRIADLFDTVQKSVQEPETEPNDEKPEANTESSPTNKADSSIPDPLQADETPTDHEEIPKDRADENDLETTKESLYNEQGFDCAGFTRNYYKAQRDSLLNLTCAAAKDMQSGNYRHACLDACCAADSGLELILVHHGIETGPMENNIEFGRQSGLISDAMADRLHGVRKLGNFGRHNIYAAANLTHKQAWFAVMQTLDFLTVVEIQLLWPEPLPDLVAEWSKEPLSPEDVITLIEEE